MERTACFGSCPVYRVEIHADGTVLYHGQAYVGAQGDRESSVDPKRVTELFDRFRRDGFWDWESEYSVLVTDMPSTILTLTGGGRTKRVRDHPSCHGDDPRFTSANDIHPPKELCELEKAVDDLAGTARWIPCRDDAGTQVECGSHHDDPPPAGVSMGDCADPYYIDSSGVRRSKPKCSRGPRRK